MRTFPQKKDLLATLAEALEFTDGQTHWDEDGVHYKRFYTKDNTLWKMYVVVVGEYGANRMPPFDQHHVPCNPVYNDACHYENWAGTIQHIKDLYQRAYSKFVRDTSIHFLSQGYWPKSPLAIVFELHTKPSDDKFGDRVISGHRSDSVQVIIAPGSIVIRNKCEENSGRSVYDMLFPLRGEQ